MSDQHIGERPAFTGPVTDTTELPLAVGGSNTLERGTALQLKNYIGTGGERRHAHAAPYDYCGTAPAGTADSAAGWTVTRITVAANGTTTVTHATGAWTDRASLTYV